MGLFVMATLAEMHSFLALPPPPKSDFVFGHTKHSSLVRLLCCPPNVSMLIQFKIICVALFMIQSLQSSFTGNEVSKIDLYIAET